MAWHFGGKVAKCDHREYGFAQVRMFKTGNGHGLFEDLGDEMQVFDPTTSQ
jgi:GMP synthase (glutamine-hydrolysing)